MSKVGRSLVGMSLLIFSTFVFAQSEDQVVEKQDDLSVQFLRIIFGDVVNVITGQPLPDPNDSLVQSDSIMGSVMEVWNGTLLIVATSFILWQTFSWLIEAAHIRRGKISQSLLWPVRVMLALAAIVPLGLGYSGYQHMLFWASGHAIQTANTMSDVVFQRLASGESFANAPSNQSTLDITTNMFESLVCLATVNNALGEIGETDDISSFLDSSQEFESDSCDSADPIRSCVTGTFSGQLQKYELAIGGNPRFINNELGIQLGHGACGSYSLQIDANEVETGSESLQLNLVNQMFSNLLDMHNALLPIAVEFANLYSNQTSLFDIESFKIRVEDISLDYTTQNQVAFNGKRKAKHHKRFRRIHRNFLRWFVYEITKDS